MEDEKRSDRRVDSITEENTIYIQHVLGEEACYP